MSEAQMKVFISWSGDYSRQLAAAIDWWLPKVLNQVEVYFSDIDIEVGSRWYHSIVDNLEKSDAGLVILTPENITRQWIMFEAGAMARSVTQARVCPILFGITKSEWNLRGGPLSFFQAAEFTEDDFRKLQKTINNSRLGEADLREVFDVWWPKLKQRIEAITIAPQPVLQEPSEKELLQEILGHTRTILREVQVQTLPASMVRHPEVVRTIRGLLRPTISNQLLGEGILSDPTLKSE
jgi:TIR domain